MKECLMDDHESTLLAEAHRGEVEAVGRLCDAHGPDLFALAWLLRGNCQAAEKAVVDTLAATVTQPRLLDPQHGLRHELARLLYLRGAAAPEVDGLPADDRATVALAILGDHSYHELATLLDRSTGEILGTLRSAVHTLHGEFSSSG